MKSKINIKSILIVAIIGIVSLVYFNPSFAANTAKVNVETANLRKEADANSAILEQVSKDQEVEILEKLDGWYKVKYKNLQGYLRQDLLNVEETTIVENTQVENTNTKTENTEVVAKQEQQPATEAEVKTEDATGMYICKDKVDLKIMPLILGHNIKEINKDATVNVLEINNKWALVESGTNRGWVLVSKIEKVSNKENQEVKQEEQPEEKVEEKKEEQPKQEVQKEVTKYINSEVVNLREGEGTSTASIAKLSKGTQVTVTSENNGWSKVKVNNKEGYVLSTLLSDRKPEVTTSRNLEQTRKETTQTQTNTSNAAEETPAQTTSSSSKGQEVCNYAKQFLGCKYVYGGTSPSGFDCSGFTQYVYKHFGVTLNRTAEAQASNGTAVSKSNLQAGDLLIFTHHAGIYLGNGTFIHAGNSKTGVIITSLSDSYYTRNYITARRIFN